MRFTSEENQDHAVLVPRFRADRRILEVLGLPPADTTAEQPVTLPLEKLTHLAYTAVARSLGGGKMLPTDSLRWDLQQLDSVPLRQRDAAYAQALEAKQAAFLEALQTHSRPAVSETDMLAEEAAARAALARDVLERVAGYTTAPQLTVDHELLGDGSLDQIAAVPAGTTEAFAADIGHLLDQETAGLRK